MTYAIMAENTQQVSQSGEIKIDIPTELLCHIQDNEPGHIYDDPRILPCLHSFCLECLKKQCEKSGTESTLACQQCKKEVPLPEGGASALPQNLRLEFKAQAIQYVLRLEGGNLDCGDCGAKSIPHDQSAFQFCCDCHEFLCEPCGQHHKRAKKTRKHDLIDTSDKQAKEKLMNSIKPPEKRYCMEQYHEEMPLGFYCKTCNKLVCQSCILGSKHKAHEYEDLGTLAKLHRSEMKALIQPTHDAASILGSAMSENDKMAQSVNSTETQVERMIEQEFQKMEEALKVRKQALLSAVKEVKVAKATRLRLQYEQFQKLKEEMEQYEDFTTLAQEEYDNYEVMALGGSLQIQLGKLLGNFHSLPLQPSECTCMPISVDTQSLVYQISQFGVVTGGCSPAHSTASIHISRAINGRERKLLVTARGQNGAPFPYGGEDVKAELRLMGSNDKPILGQAADNGDGTYAVSFIPQAIGMHELSITIRNQPIKGSPFEIHVREPRDYTTLSSSPQQNFSNLEGNNVYSVALHENGELYIAQPHYIRILKPDGTTRTTLGSHGSGNGQFSSPYGIAIRGVVMYVTDRDNHRVQKLSTSGEYISQFGGNGSGNGQFSGPRGVCLDPEGRVFVSDHSNNRVQVFEAEGTFAYCIPSDQSPEAKISNPVGLAFDDLGRLHVASYGTNTIKVFTPEGKIVEEYGSGSLTCPAGIAVDEEGYTFVSEHNSTSSRLQIFDPTHKVIRSITGFNNARIPALSRDGVIYVSDVSNCRVLEF